MLSGVGRECDGESRESVMSQEIFSSVNLTSFTFLTMIAYDSMFHNGFFFKGVTRVLHVTRVFRIQSTNITFFTLVAYGQNAKQSILDRKSLESLLCVKRVTVMV
jgi:hypothetical protein